MLRLVFLLFSCVITVSVFAQELHSVNMSAPGEITFVPGINSLDIELSNDGIAAFSGYVQLGLPAEIGLLSNNKTWVKIGQGKKRFISIKLRTYSLSNLKDGKINVIIFKETGEELLRKEVRINVPEKRLVQLQNNSGIQYLKTVGDSIIVQLRLLNSGTTDEPVKLLFSSPDRVGKIFFKEIDIYLRSGVDTLIRHSFLVEPFMLNLSQYSVRVAGIYGDSDVFGNLNIFYSNIASTRNFQRMFAPLNELSTYSPNFMEFRLSNMLNNQQSYNFLSQGAYRLGDTKLRYAASINRWGGDTRLNINNTYLEIENKGHTVGVGNIQENLEAPFYGRGGMYSFLDTAADYQLSFGLIERSHDLFGAYDQTDPGGTFFGRLKLAQNSRDRKRYEGQVVYDNNKLDSVSSVLWTNRFDIARPQRDDGLRVEGFLAGGVQQYKGLFPKSEPTMPSFAGGIKLEQYSRHWSFSSDNFYSTGYFPGNRRGAIQLNQRVSRNIKRSTFGIGYTFSEYQPQYLNPYFSVFNSGVSKIEMPFSMPLSTRGQLTITPSHKKEYADYMLSDSPIRLDASSTLLMTTMSMRSKNLKHSLFTTIEGGRSASEDGLSSASFVIRGDVSYNYNRLSLFADFQNGPFQVYDWMSAAVLDRSFGQRYAAGVRYQGDLFQKKVDWNANVTGQYNSGWGQAIGGNWQANYRIGSATQLRALFQYTYNVGATNYSYHYTNLQIGVRQQLRSQDLDKKPIKTGDLEIFCFYDHNNNEIYDHGDEVAVDYGFMVRNILFVTNKKGISVFKKMPYDNYVLFFPLKNHYQAVSREVQINRSTHKITVALQRVGTVKGNMFLDYDPAIHLSVNTDMMLYTIIAENEQGRKFEARTDISGAFEVRLPFGKYKIYPDPNRFPENVYFEQPAQEVWIKVGEEIILSPFQLKVKSKTVEVKRFGKKD